MLTTATPCVEYSAARLFAVRFHFIRQMAPPSAVQDLGSLAGRGRCTQEIESCKIVFPWGHFLFTCWDTFAVGCMYRLGTTQSFTDERTDRQTTLSRQQPIIRSAKKIYRQKVASGSIAAYFYFCARQHICYSAYMLSPVRPSVRLSVTRVIHSKTVEVRIMQLSPPGSPMTLVSSRLTSPRNSKGNLGSEGAK